MSYNNGQAAAELWAIINKDGDVMYSRGGSSSTPRLMVYTSEKKARVVLKNPWIKQIIQSEKDVQVIKIYPQ